MNETIQFIDLQYSDSFLILKTNIWIIIIILAIYLIYFIINHFSLHNKLNAELVEISFDLKGPSATYKIQRNYENIEIAHRIYTELVTRKAAIPIDYENDVIIEIYDSWYQLFKITREELKKISGRSLKDRRGTDQLIQMATDVLNCGLRPHLTKYQAKFRKWYKEELENEELKGQCPQMIQKQFSEYAELVESMKDVNKILINYSEQLHNFIIGESCH